MRRSNRTITAILVTVLGFALIVSPAMAQDQPIEYGQTVTGEITNNLSRNPISCRRDDDDCFTPGKLRQTTAPLVAKIGKLARFSGKNRQIPTPLPARIGRFRPHPRQDSANSLTPSGKLRQTHHPCQTLIPDR